MDINLVIIFGAFITTYTGAFGNDETFCTEFDNNCRAYIGGSINLTCSSPMIVVIDNVTSYYTTVGRDISCTSTTAVQSQVHVCQIQQSHTCMITVDSSVMTIDDIECDALPQLAYADVHFYCKSTDEMSTRHEQQVTGTTQASEPNSTSNPNHKNSSNTVNYSMIIFIVIAVAIAIIIVIVVVILRIRCLSKRNTRYVVFHRRVSTSS